jgi:phosphatidylserine/phosphatidylglycerophosphate/cardiolipin synthase-like enzyme
MKKLSLFLSLLLISSSAAYGMEKGKNPARTGLYSMSEMANDLEEKGSGSASPMSITGQLAPTPYTRCYFTPNIKDAFLNCIANEQEAVRGAFFRFTLYDAAQAIVKGLKEREITAKLVVDGNHISDDFCSPLKLILDNGGKVLQVSQNRFQNNPGKFEIMHHKFMIFRKNIENKKILWTGSWNATGQASGKNCENVMVTDNQEMIAEFEKEMIELKKISTALTAQGCVSTKDMDPKINFARRMNGIPELK